MHGVRLEQTLYAIPTGDSYSVYVTAYKAVLNYKKTIIVTKLTRKYVAGTIFQ